MLRGCQYSPARPILAGLYHHDFRVMARCKTYLNVEQSSVLPF
jgi:hypothetical protein